jgi:hypothetical protein
VGHHQRAASGPTAARGRPGRLFVLRLPRSAASLWRTMSLAAAGDGRSRRLPGPVGGELAAGRAGVLAAIGADGDADAAWRTGPRTRRRAPAAGLPGRVGDRVHRDQVDVGQVPAQQRGQGVGVDVGVVHAGNHHVLVAHAPAGYARVVAAAATTSATGQRRFSGTSTSRSGSRAAWRLIASVNCGPSAVSGGSRARRPRWRRPRAAPQAELARVGQDGHGLQDAVQVEQRLAHAHEDDVGQVAAGRRPGGGPRGGPDRRSPRSRDRARSRARRWRRTGSRRRSRPGSRCTACGARDGAGRPGRRSRAPGSASAPTRSAPRRQQVERLLGQAAVGDLDLVLGDRVDAEGLVDPAAESGRQGQQLVGGFGRSGARRVADLPGAVRRLALGREPLLQLAVGQTAQPGGRPWSATVRGIAVARTRPFGGSEAGAWVGAGGRSPVASVGLTGRRLSHAGRGPGAGPSAVPATCRPGPGYPRRKSSAADVRVLPASWTSSRTSRPPAAARPDRPPGGYDKPSGFVARPMRPTYRARQTIRRPSGSRCSCPARADRRGPGAPARGRRVGSSRPSSRRSGLVSVTPSVRLRSGLQLPGQPLRQGPAKQPAAARPRAPPGSPPCRPAGPRAAPWPRSGRRPSPRSRP